MLIIHVLIPLFIIFTPFQFDDGSGNNDSFQLSEDVNLSPFEAALFDEINSYRAKHGLPPIAFSPSLTKVAQLHSRDLAINQPHRRSNCNMHSWSKKGNWSACCYTPDHKRSACMWNKPRELTSYQGDGFEIAFFSTAAYNDARSFSEDAIKNWSKSSGHNNVILNKSTWKKVTWKAMGVGHYDGYATVWFGMLDDPLTIK